MLPTWAAARVLMVEDSVHSWSTVWQSLTQGTPCPWSSRSRMLACRMADGHAGQFVDDYMDSSGFTHGLYLLGWFDCEAWRDRRRAARMSGGIGVSPAAAREDGLRAVD